MGGHLAKVVRSQRCAAAASAACDHGRTCLLIFFFFLLHAADALRPLTPILIRHSRQMLRSLDRPRRGVVAGRFKSASAVSLSDRIHPAPLRVFKDSRLQIKNAVVISKRPFPIKSTLHFSSRSPKLPVCPALLCQPHVHIISASCDE